MSPCPYIIFLACFPFSISGQKPEKLLCHRQLTQMVRYQHQGANKQGGEEPCLEKVDLQRGTLIFHVTLDY